MSEQNAVDTSSYDTTEEYSGGDYGNADFESSESGEANDGGQPGPGMGQSKSSRRRRRKRKNKVAGEGPAVAGGDGEAGPQVVPLVMEGESLALAASAAPQQARRPQGQRTATGPGPAAGPGPRRQALEEEVSGPGAAAGRRRGWPERESGQRLPCRG